MENWVIDALKEFGWTVGIVIFFIYRDYVREAKLTRVNDELANKLTKLEAEMRGILKELVEKCTAALVDNTHVMSGLVSLLTKRPCFIYDLFKVKDEVVLRPKQEG
jgi:hypothetical protein